MLDLTLTRSIPKLYYIDGANLTLLSQYYEIELGLKSTFKGLLGLHRTLSTNI